MRCGLWGEGTGKCACWAQNAHFPNRDITTASVATTNDGDDDASDASDNDMPSARQITRASRYVCVDVFVAAA